MSIESTPACPICGAPLVYRDRRKRVWKHAGGNKSYVSIRRLKCTRCNRLHNELPHFLAPFKHYEISLIEKAVDNPMDTDLDDENYPCDFTRNRWHQWFQKNQLLIDGYLKSVFYRIVNRNERILKSGESMLMKMRSENSEWFSAILRNIYNTGGFLPT